VLILTTLKGKHPDDVSGDIMSIVYDKCYNNVKEQRDGN
jgi:hypothetical protein